MSIKQVYRVSPSSSHFGQVLIFGEHKWILPGLSCPRCETWGAAGNEFPCIEPSKEQAKYFKNSPQSLGWHRDILPRARLKLPDGSIPGPTAEFGPFEGKIDSGKSITDFTWPRSWTVLATNKVRKLLSESDLLIDGFAEAQIKGSAKFQETFHELQIRGGLNLDERCMERSGPDCRLCGRSPVKLSSLPLKLRVGNLQHDLFRAANFATLLFATENFVSFCKKQSFSNITFQPVELID